VSDDPLQVCDHILTYEDVGHVDVGRAASDPSPHCLEYGGLGHGGLVEGLAGLGEAVEQSVWPLTAARANASEWRMAKNVRQNPGAKETVCMSNWVSRSSTNSVIILRSQLGQEGSSRISSVRAIARFRVQTCVMRSVSIKPLSKVALNSWFHPLHRFDRAKMSDGE
jgi:hypothetical protein